MSAKVGSFTQPAATGNQAVTGVGFKPTVVLFFATDQTADGNGADIALTIGAAVSSTVRGVSYSKVSAGASGNRVAKARLTACIGVTSATGAGAGTDTGLADLVSMDTDGFTINWSVTDGTARIISYLALGGSLSSAFVNSLTVPAATGSQAITGVGFKPDSVFFWYPSTSTGAIPLTNGGVLQGLGPSVASKSEFSNSVMQPVAASPSHHQAANAVDNTNTGTQPIATLTSLDADGFTLNWSAIVSGRKLLFLAMKGGSVAVGTFNQQTSTGSQAVTGVGFKPSAMLFQGVDDVTTGAVGNNGRLSLGLVSSDLTQASLWGGVDTTTGQLASHDYDRTKAIKAWTEGGASPTLNAAASLTSFDSDGFTVNWSTADATAREIIYLAFGFVQLSSSITGSGGVKVSGTGAPLAGATVTGAGGVRVSGAATKLAGRTITGSSGVKVSGVATVTTGRPRIITLTSKATTTLTRTSAANRLIALTSKAQRVFTLQSKEGDMSVINNENFYRGEDLVFNFTEQSVTDITGWTIQLILKLPNGSKITKNATLTSPTTAQYSLTLAAADTVRMPPDVAIPYDVWRTDSGFAGVLSKGAFTAQADARY